MTRDPFNHEPPSISFTQYKVLCFLHHEPLINTTLSERCGMFENSCIRCCNSLIKKGFVKVEKKFQNNHYSITLFGIMELERVKEFIDYFYPLNITV